MLWISINRTVQKDIKFKRNKSSKQTFNKDSEKKEQSHLILKKKKEYFFSNQTDEVGNEIQTQPRKKEKKNHDFKKEMQRFSNIETCQN